MSTVDVASTRSAANPAEARVHMLQTARELVPLLRRNSEQSERDRQLTPEVEDALRSAGLFQVTTPRRSGGGGGNIRTLIEVSAEIARGDSSAGWVAFIANTTAFGMALFDDDVRDVVYADPRNVAVSQFGPNGTAREVDGGYRVSGSWAFASGCYQAQWTLNGIKIVDDAGNPKEIRFALLPRTDLEIEDTWDMAGMAGTGSNTFVADDAFVPHEFTIDFDTFQGYKPFTPWHENEAYYRVPLGPAACLAISGPIMGMAEGAWDLTLAAMDGDKPITNWNYTNKRQSPSYRLALADARMAIDTGRFHLLRAADDMDTAATEGRLLDITARARIRGDSAVAARSFRHAVGLLLDISGTSSFNLSNPLQRIWRDITVACSHSLNNILLNREIYAHEISGLDTFEVGPL
ncbi:acyl-CoA dehydrogenase family protein [Mycolicibacterium nivoides]|uniref:acyl-CoA dehydrogenase family protein n=1 Tax=Mycolicibacterium nivoides TaxID=2487344 RepID=UPI003C2E5510